MTMLDDVANEILRRCTELMAVNDCQADELAMAQTICHEQRDNPAKMTPEQIKEFLEEQHRQWKRSKFGGL